MFVFRELVGTIRIKTGMLFLGLITAIFAFLAIFSCFFLAGTPVETRALPASPPGEVTVYLSPRLSNQEINALYQSLLARPDVAQIHFLLGSELTPPRMGGAFVIQATSPSAAATLGKVIGSLAGVEKTSVVQQATHIHLNLSLPARIGLLLGLVVTGFLALFIARATFLNLLHDFAPHIVLMELAGAPERTLQSAIIVLGLICGLVAGVLLIAVVYIIHTSALSPSGTLLSTAAGFTDSARVLVASLLSLLIGLVFGGLAGILGASFIPRFRA